MNWDQWIDELCEANECTLKHIERAGWNRRQARELAKQQRDIRTAAKAVRQAYEANPTGTREQTRDEAYKFLTGGVILTILVQALLTVAVKLAIEWFLDRLYNSQESSHGGLPLSPE
jgi:hypothetical protein